MSDSFALLRDALGEFILSMLDNSKVTDILVNPDGRIWINSLDQGLVDSERRMSPQDARMVIINVAGLLKQVANDEHPEVEGELPLDGHRFEGVLPPISEGPWFAIRRHASQIFTLDQQVRAGIITPGQVAVLRELLRLRRNILIVGGTGTGKTTIINTLLDEVRLFDPICRFFIIEDTREIRCLGIGAVSMRSTEKITMARLLRIAMRSLPKRIIVGEMRGAEALMLLKAWNSGHPGGFATIHADSALEGLHKLNEYVEEALVGPKYKMIAQTVHAVLHITYENGVRRLSEILSVKGWDGTEFITESLA